MDSMIGDMSPNRLFVAFDRAAHDVGQEEPEVDCPLFQERFAYHLRHLAVGQTLEDLKEKGVALIAATETTGAHIWALV